jgi:hypothetical protein
LPGVDDGAGERTTDPAAAETASGDEASHSPDDVVGLVLRLGPPRDTGLEEQARVGAPRLDRAPADRLAIEVCD